jgi:hypothetical protein
MDKFEQVLQLVLFLWTDLQQAPYTVMEFHI